VAVLGVGGSGASTVAVEMAACLSRLRPTVLVDLDLLHPSLLLYLGQPIAHNLNTIAQDNPQTPIAWETTLTREITRLPVPLSDLHLINGLPHPEARHLVTPAFIDRLVEALRLRFGQIVLDVGSDLTSADTAARAHRQVVRLADRVVLVVQPDYSASWRLRHLITQLDGELRIPVERLEIIVNGIGDGTTIPRHELVEEFGPIMAWVPFDRRRILTARRQRQPLLLAAPGPAERALGRYARQLAKRLGTIDGERMPGWHRWLRLWRRSPLRPTELTKGSSHVG
jgi:Flp pilus assembly CpaE family ATPase